MDLSAYLYIRTNTCTSCLMRSFLIAVVCMSDSLRASAQIHSYYFKRSMAVKRTICNLEAYDKYIKKFKSDWEAAGLFLSDEGLLSEKADVFCLHKNESQGLGTLSEEPLEHNNKNLCIERSWLENNTAG